MFSPNTGNTAGHMKNVHPLIQPGAKSLSAIRQEKGKTKPKTTHSLVKK